MKQDAEALMPPPSARHSSQVRVASDVTSPVTAGERSSSMFDRVYDYGYVGSRIIDVAHASKYPSPATTSIEASQLVQNAPFHYSHQYASRPPDAPQHYAAPLPNVDLTYIEPYSSLPSQQYASNLSQTPSSFLPNAPPVSTRTPQAPLSFVPSIPNREPPPPSLIEDPSSSEAAAPDITEAGSTASWDYYSPDTTLYLKIQTLPVLDNLVSFGFSLYLFCPSCLFDLL